MHNDLFDWRKDLEFQTRTYFLSEGDRRRQPSESITEWFVREGFDWGRQTLVSWMVQLRAQGADLDCPDLMAYLDEREALLREKCESVVPGLRSLGQLLETLKQSAEPG